MLELSLSTLLPTPKAPGAGANPAAAGAFSVTLADLIGIGVDPASGAGAPVVATPGRQAAAESGKPLPDGGIVKADPIDPALAWFGIDETIAAEAVVPAIAPTAADPAPTIPDGGDGSPVVALPEPQSSKADAAPAAKAAADAVLEIAVTKVTNPDRPADSHKTKKHPDAKRDSAAPEDSDAPAAPAPIVLSPSALIAGAPTPIVVPVAATSAPLAVRAAVSPSAGTAAAAQSAPLATHAAPHAVEMPTERSPIDLPDDGETAPAVAVSVENPAFRPKRAVGKNDPAFFPVLPKPAKADAGAAPAVAIRARVGTESIPARAETPALVVPGNVPQQATPVAASPTFSPRPEGTQPVQPAPVGVPSTGDMLVADTPAAPRESARTDSAPSVQPPQANPAPAALQPVAPAPAQPAGIVFGFALAGIFEQRQPADPTDRSAPRDQALQALTAAAGSAQAVGAVAGTGDARHAALDMRRDDWPQAMIDRIEALRDSADAADTRIRLIPDALGKVDVSLRHDGDAVHVHFAAEIASTRALLADAQPRLADAAQARGLRLGQATVDAGSGQAGRQPQQQPAAPTPLPARPAPAAIADTDAHPESSRLA